MRIRKSAPRSDGFQDFDGPYILEMRPGASMDEVVPSSHLRVEGDLIKVECGEIRIFPYYVVFMVGESNEEIFVFHKTQIVSIKNGYGCILWEAQRGAVAA